MLAALAGRTAARGCYSGLKGLGLAGGRTTATADVAASARCFSAAAAEPEGSVTVEVREGKLGLGQQRFLHRTEGPACQRLTSLCGLSLAVHLDSPHPPLGLEPCVRHQVNRYKGHHVDPPSTTVTATRSELLQYFKGTQAQFEGGRWGLADRSTQALPPPTPTCNHPCGILPLPLIRRSHVALPLADMSRLRRMKIESGRALLPPPRASPAVPPRLNIRACCRHVPPAPHGDCVRHAVQGKTDPRVLPPVSRFQAALQNVSGRAGPLLSPSRAMPPVHPPPAAATTGKRRWRWAWKQL